MSQLKLGEKEREREREREREIQHSSSAFLFYVALSVLGDAHPHW
jgi:hypothetical protein